MLQVTPSSRSILGDRFEVLGELGAGSFGRVLRARDHRYGLELAVKVLATLDPSALLRFKNEFRALAHVSHSNLVTLYELHAHEGTWYFTMELIEGATLDRWLTAAPRSIDELRSALSQIASGLEALHDGGLSHRDLKPSNVLVSANGRVALADFGMVGTADPARRENDESQMGSVAYSAPESWTGHSAGRAADWYAFGVTMFEALTGKRPFEGTMPAQIAGRIMRDGPRPSSVAPGVPADLDELCAALLRRDPGARPDARACVAALSGGSTPRVWLSGSAPFVGRERDLEALERALDETRDGGARVLLVTGPSGIGKSSLVEQLARRASARGALVLEGRCHPHDGLSARALDGIVDALARHLAREPDDVPDEALEGSGALLRMFPALRGALPGAGATREPRSKQQREDALACLAHLLVQVAAKRPLALVIDDLQWADEESGTSLGTLVRAIEGGPGPLVLATVREEHAGSSPCLRALRSAVPGARTHRLAALDPGAARGVVDAVLGGAFLAAGGEARVPPVLAAAQGNPYLLLELAAALRGRVTPLREGDDPVALIDEVVGARAAAVPASARRMLEVLSLAEEPLDPAVAIAAAGIAESDYLHDLSVLRAQRLVSPRLAEGRQTIEPYHARVRESVARSLAPDTRKASHRALARALEAVGTTARDTLARHAFEGDDLERAHEHARAAADDARAALAFGACASMLRLALSTGRVRPEEIRQVQGELADALANAGRGRESADAFLTLAAADPERAAEHERRAAEQLLFSGHLTEGVEVLDRVLARVGLARPRSRALAVARVLWAQTFGAGRRVLREDLGSGEVDPALFARVDASHAASLGLTMTDPLASAAMQVRHLEDALAARDPARLVRALAIHTVHTAGSAYEPAHTRRLRDVVQALVRRDGTPETAAYAASSNAAVAWMEGRLDEAMRELEHAGTMLRSASCVGMQWHIDTQRVMELELLEAKGAWDAINPRLALYQKDAEERGDRYLESALRVRFRPTVLLAADRASSARAEIAAARRVWGQSQFDLVALYAAVRTSWCDLHEGDAQRAHATMESAWREMQKSLLVRVAFYRDMASAARAVALLSWARIAPPRARDAARDQGRTIARALIATRAPLSVAYGTMLEASARGGDPARYREAARRFDALGAAMLATACRFRAALAEGGDAAAVASEAPARLARAERVMIVLAP